MRKKLKAYNLNFKLMGKSHSKVYYEEPEFKRPVCCNFGFLIQSMQTNVERKTFSLPFNGLDILKEHGFSDKELKKIIIISKNEIGGLGSFEFHLFQNYTTAILMEVKTKNIQDDFIQIDMKKATCSCQNITATYFEEWEFIKNECLKELRAALNVSDLTGNSNIRALSNQEIQNIEENLAPKIIMDRSSKKIKKPKKNYSGDLKFKASIMKEVGGLGGNPFIISNNSKITDIWIRYGNVIDSIAWRYEDGTYHRYGGSGGSEIHIQFDDDEFLQGIFGKSGSFIDSMGFITNNGDEVYGPFGGTGGYDFNFLANGQSYIQGFKGRSGCYIDRIGIIMDS